MLDLLRNWFPDLANLLQSNAVLGGIVGAWLLGSATYLVTKLPAKVVSLVKSQLTTSIRMTNTGWWGNRQMVEAFSEWYIKNLDLRFSRKFSVDTRQNGGNIVIGPGLGGHIFWFKGRMFWLTKDELPSTGTESQKEAFTIHTFGRSRKPLDNLLEHFAPKDPDDGKIKLYYPSSMGSWDLGARIAKRPLDSVIIDPAILDDLLEQLNEFRDKRDWYLNVGLAHKLSVLLYGIPGSGKTSLIKALAGHFGVSIYVLNVSNITDSQLERLLANVPAGNFVLMEELDSASATHRRTPEVKRNSDDPQPDTVAVPGMPAPAQITMDFSMLTIGGLLTALDGIVSLDNIVIFSTTNHIEKIDDALLREGRFDLRYNLGKLGDAEIKRFVQHFYKQSDLAAERFVPIAGCDVQGLLRRHKENYAGFRRDLINRYSTKIREVEYEHHQPIR